MWPRRCKNQKQAASDFQKVQRFFELKLGELRGRGRWRRRPTFWPFPAGLATFLQMGQRSYVWPPAWYQKSQVHLHRCAAQQGNRLRKPGRPFDYLKALTSTVAALILEAFLEMRVVLLTPSRAGRLGGPPESLTKAPASAKSSWRHDAKKPGL